ncbi:MAG: hypothetical protein MJ092_07910, partial [Lachnospiraceae bacterium]|nr:hypothetical protein [Lachnospiraceae bacterium]
IITRASKWQDANPDVLEFSAVTGCDTNISESRIEQKQKDREGKDISYNPPRYDYHYNFTVTVYVNNPYFDDMRFNVNSSSVTEEQIGSMHRHGQAYEKYVAMQEEIKSIFSGMREDARAEVAAAAAPKIQMTCPCCGATTVPDAKGCCEFCGTKIV